jgi:hypothetical protein
MFPNVRLMIVAMSASLLAVISAMTLFMGMFAAFSVTHEPFSGSRAGRPPLQIASADGTFAPVADGKPAPFGIRFQLNAPQVPSGPVIVAVPEALDRVPQDAAAEAGGNAGSDPDSALAQPQDNAAQSLSRDAPANGAVQSPAQPAVSERPTLLGAPQHVAPEIKIVAREAENPASVTTSPAPALAHNAIKRRKLAVRLHQPHHFRRPRIHPIADNQTSRQTPGQTTGYVPPNGLSQLNGFGQPNVNSFVQPGFQFTPAAIKPRPVKLRRSARNASGNSASQ